MNIIEQLQANEKPFGLMSAEMQGEAKRIGKTKFEHFNDCSKWVCANLPRFESQSTYRLRFDYQEEPEIVECEIYRVQDGVFDVEVYDFDGDEENCLNVIPHGYERLGFKFADGGVSVVRLVYRNPLGIVCDCPADEIAKQQILHATHVLFRRQT